MCDENIDPDIWKSNTDAIISLKMQLIVNYLASGGLYLRICIHIL